MMMHSIISPATQQDNKRNATQIADNKPLLLWMIWMMTSIMMDILMIITTETDPTATQGVIEAEQGIIEEETGVVVHDTTTEMMNIWIIINMMINMMIIMMKITELNIFMKRKTENKGE